MRLPSLPARRSKTLSSDPLSGNGTGHKGSIFGNSRLLQKSSVSDAPGASQIAHYLSSIEELETLKAHWTDSLSYSDGPGLDCEQFIAVVTSALPLVTRPSLEVFFSHMDVHATGYVAWDTFFSVVFEESKKSSSPEGEQTDTHQQKAFRERQLPQGSGTQGGDSIKALHHVSNEFPYVVGVCRDRIRVVRPYSCDVLHTIPITDEGQITGVTYIPSAYVKDCVGKAEKKQGVLVVSCSDLSLRVVGASDFVQRVAKVEAPSHSTIMYTSLMKPEAGGVILAGTRTGSLQVFSAHSILSTTAEIGSRVMKANLKRDISSLVSPLCVITPHTDAITCIVILDAKKQIATASLDSIIKLFDIVPSSCTVVPSAHFKDVVLEPTPFSLNLKFSSHSSAVLCMAYSEEHGMLISAGNGKIPLCFNINSGRSTSAYPLSDSQSPHMHQVVQVRFVPGTRKCISHDAQHVFKVWDVRTYQILQTFAPPSANAGSARNEEDEEGGRSSGVSALQPPMPGGSAARRSAGFVYINKYIVAYTSCFCSWVSTASVNPTAADDRPLTAVVTLGNVIVTCAGRAVKVWCAFSGRISKHFPMISSTEVTGVAGDFFAKRLCVSHHEAPVTVHHLDTGEMLNRIPCTDANGAPKEVAKLNYDVVRSTLHVAYDDGTLLVVNDKDSLRRTMKTCRVHQKAVKLLAMSQKHGYLATGDTDRISLWNVTNMALLMSFSATTGECITAKTQLSAEPHRMAKVMTDMIIMPNAPCIICADSGGTIILFSVAPQEGRSVEVTRWRMTASQVGAQSASPKREGGGEGMQHLMLDTSEQAACLGLAYHWQASLLYSLDERGVVTAWSLDAVMDAARIVTDGSTQTDTPVPCPANLVTVSTWFWSDPAQHHPFKGLRYSPELACILAWNEIGVVQCWDEVCRVVIMQKTFSSKYRTER